MAFGAITAMTGLVRKRLTPRDPTSDLQGAIADIAQWANDPDTFSAGPRKSYTVVLTGSTTNPNIGSTGTTRGTYRVVNDRCYWSATVVFNGAGVAAGVGDYSLNLPRAPFVPSGGFLQVGVGWYYSSGGFRLIGLDTAPGGLATRIIYDGGIVGAAAPAAPAVGSVISVFGDYEVAV